MPLEYEYRYQEKRFDKNLIRQKLEELGAIKHGDWVFRVMVFQDPRANPSPYIRIRDEGHRITMTYKVHGFNKYVDETETDISDYDAGVKILEGLGCVKKYYYEKIREIWHLNDVEICFDTNPGRPDIMEIEAKEEVDLLKTVSLLGLDDVPHDEFKDHQLYEEAFGITMPKNIDLTFDTVIEVLGKYCTKNREEFERLVLEQNEFYGRTKK